MRLALLTLLVATLGLFEFAPSAPAAASGPRADVIVTLAGDIPGGAHATPARMRRTRARIGADARALDVRALDIYTTGARSFRANVSDAQRQRLEHDRRVLAVVDDGLIDGASDLEDSGSKVIGRPAKERVRRQITPSWLRRIGVTAVDHRLGSGRRHRAFDADVAVIDSGIRRNHPDVRPAGGKDCTHSGSWGDAYGHGLGVASILGARDDRRGIVGMLPGVRLWSVRVFDARGRTRMSWLLCGLDWVANKRDRRHPSRPFFEGATLSFSAGPSGPGYVPNGNCGRHPVDLIHRAICRIEGRGTILVAAAGNYGQKASLRRPAGFKEVITVSAMADFDGRPGGKGRQASACRSGAAPERDDRFASFSSYGAGVDLIAPGKCIWVAYGSSGYARVSGTSFAAPMVLGAALLYRKRYPSARPNQVRMALIRAGRRDWRTGSDPDRAHEPRVDVRHFAAPPTFQYDRQVRRRIMRGGKAIRLRLHVRRLRGHTATIRLRPSHAPPGIRVAIDGARVTIEARPGARAGTRTVTLRASDGEVVRAIRVPIRVVSR